jgi:hypothetical protein
MSHPQLVRMSLVVPNANAGSRTLVLRGVAWGLEPQVEGVRCGKQPVESIGRGTWRLPVGCKRVTWNVRANRASVGSVDASRQATLLFEDPRWVLLSEATSIPRLEGDESSSSIAIYAWGGGEPGRVVGASQAGENSWLLPSTRSGPEYFVVGDAPTRERSVGPFRVRYVYDDLARVEQLGLERMHEAVLSYLATVLPPPASVPQSRRTLMVVWLGRDDASGQFGGAAGSRSFLANYRYAGQAQQPPDQSLTLMTMAHEQFHQLAGLVRGSRPALPLWLNESLASYYGLKALDRVSSTAAARELRGQFISPSRPVHAGLIELDRQRALGDGKAYRSIYEQGATFWAQLDGAVSASPGEPRGLDPLMPILLRGATSKAEPLPREFVDDLRAIIGPRADALISEYVGE